MFKMAGGKDKETALSRWQAIIPTVSSKSSIPRVSILTSGKQTGFAGTNKNSLPCSHRLPTHFLTQVWQKELR